MKATIHFKDGSKQEKTITHVTSDGFSTYGVIRHQGHLYEVTRTTTIIHADGRITYEWEQLDQIQPPSWH